MRTLVLAGGWLAAVSAGPAAAQVPNLFLRNDNFQNVSQFSIGTKSFVCAHPNLVQFVQPPQATPDYIYGYVQTCPNLGTNGNPFGTAVYSNMFFRNANVRMSYFGNGNSHTFRKLPTQPQPVFGPAQFCATYSVSGNVIKDVVFTSRPTGRIQGSSANLTAVLTSTRVGLGSPPQFNVTGFFIDQGGINNVNLVSPIGGITFNTFLATSPQTVTMPLVNLTVPSTVMPQKPANPTSMSFKVLYRLQL